MLFEEGAIAEETVGDMLSWPHSGFQAWIGDLGWLSPESRRDALEKVTRYIVRAPVALNRMIVKPSGQGKIIYRSDKTHPRHKGNFRVLDPPDFLAELSAQIPDPYEKTVLYYGRYSNRSRGDRRDKSRTEVEIVRARQDKEADRRMRRSWARMIKRVYEVDPLECPTCHGRMRVVAFIDQAEVVEKILRHIGAWEEPVPRSHAPPEGIRVEETVEPFYDDLPVVEDDVA